MAPVDLPMTGLSVRVNKSAVPGVGEIMSLIFNPLCCYAIKTLKRWRHLLLTQWLSITRFHTKDVSP